MNLVRHILKNVNATDFLSACLLHGTSIEESFNLASAILFKQNDAVTKKITTILKQYKDKEQAALNIFRVFPPFIKGDLTETIEEDTDQFNLVKLIITTN